MSSRFWPFYFSYYYALDTVILVAAWVAAPLIPLQAVVLTFSVSSPVITLFGCLYFGVRYCADKVDILVYCEAESDSHEFLAKKMPIYVIIGAPIVPRRARLTSPQPRALRRFSMGALS